MTTLDMFGKRAYAVITDDTETGDPIYHCPECLTSDLAIYARVWVNWPEREILPEDAEEAYVRGDEEAICRGCQHTFKLGGRYDSER